MGGYLDKPITSGQADSGSSASNMVKYGSFGMQGFRPTNEDASMVKLDVDETLEGLFCIFDGHGGGSVSSYCASYTLKCLKSLFSYKAKEHIGQCLKEVFFRLDASLLTTRGKSQLKRLSDIEEQVVCVHRDIICVLEKEHQHKQTVESKSDEEELPNRKRKRKSTDPQHEIWEKIRRIGKERGFTKPQKNIVSKNKTRRAGVEILPKAKLGKYKNDVSDMLLVGMNELKPKIPGFHSGCTALACAVEKTNHEDIRKVTVANLGDSRCVLSRNGVAIDLSKDHSPLLSIEKTRIEKAGGTVTKEGRINGKLNLSRAIGDHQYKMNKNLKAGQQMVSSIADIQTTFVEKGVHEFVVLACDGIWDCMSSQEVVDYIAKGIKQGLKLDDIARNLCKSCLAKDVTTDPGTDNMTVVIVQLF